MDKLIEIDQISACYGRKVALQNVSLSVYKHDFLGIIGPNGGGKTTLLKVILGLIKPTTGTIQYYDKGAAISAYVSATYLR